MAEIKKISTELQLLDKFLDTSGDAGTAGQVLTSTGTGINWVSAGTPGSGVYLPLAGGTMTGSIVFNNNVAETWKDNAGATTRMMILNSTNVAYIGPIDTYAGGPILYGTSADVTAQIFYTGASERMRITSAGNVGIATTSPGTALQVGGLDDGSNYDITVGWNAVSSQAVGTKRSALTFKTSQTGVNNEDIYKWDIAMVTAPATASSEPFGSDLAFLRSTRSSTSVDETTMILTQLGNVGIGTTSPNQKLQVGGNLHVYDEVGNTDAAIFISTGTSNVTTVKIASNGNSFFNGGNVGIGTTSPGAKLNVTGNYGDVIKAVSGSQSIATNFVAPTTGSGRNNIISTAGEFNIGTSDAQPFSLATSNISRVSILSGGNVGIGTTAPGVRLHVNGGGGILVNNGGSDTVLSANSNTGVFIIGDTEELGDGVYATNTNTSSFDIYSTGSIKFRMKSNGDVGIGTTTPGSKLEVAGNTLIDGVLTVEGPAPGSTTPMLKLNRTSPVVDYKDLNSSGFFLLKERFINSGNTVIGSREVAQNPGGSGIYHNFDNGATGGSQFHQKQNSFHWKINSTSEKLTLGTNGYFGINDTSPSYQLDVNGSGRFTSTVTATNFILSSDERLKENVEKVCDNRVKADWKTFELKTEKGQKRYGVIAQELEKTNPEFVREDSQGFKSVAYIDLLIAKIAELEARLEKLEK